MIRWRIGLPWLRLFWRLGRWLIALPLILSLGALSVGRILPQGAEVAFMYDPSGNDQDWDIYLLDVRRGVIQALIDTDARERYPAWSPDGKQIAYHALQDESYDLFIADASGNRIRPLNVFTGDPYNDDAMIDWSPDGKQIVFHSGYGIGQNFNVYIGDPEGEHYEPLLPDMSGTLHGAWSPDGTKIAFVSVDSGDVRERWTLNVLDLTADPTDPLESKQRIRQLTKGVYNSYFPTWSPDGTKIAFVLDQNGTGDILVMGADGGNVRNLTESPQVDETQPEWLPDGSGIIFAADRGEGYDLYIMDADGGNVRRVTYARGDEMAPDWRP